MRISPLWCSYVLDPEVAPPRVAFAIGRAVGTAVERNRLRRRLRALLASSDLPPGLFLLGATPGTCERTFDDLARSIDQLLERVRSNTVRPQ